MQPTKPSAAPNTNEQPKQPTLTTETAGQFAGVPSSAIDDGSEYGDPHADDDVPDFIKADERGWTKLWPLRR